MSHGIDFSQFNHCISTVPLFQSLSLDQIHAVQTKIKEKTLEAGELLYRSGDETDTLYLVQSGLLRIYRMSASGKEQHIRLLEQGDFTGEMALFNQRQYDRFIQAVEDTTLCCINQQDFKEILSENAQITLELLAVLANRLDDSEQQTTSITTETIRTRLAKYLWLESQKQQNKYVKLPTTKKNIASYLGMTPESFSRELSKLTKEKILRQPAPDVIQITNINALEQLSLK